MTDIGAQALVANADSALEQVLALADADPHQRPGGTYGAKRVADVLLHLHAWHLVFGTWMSEHRRGGTPAVPAEGYTWSELDALNETFYATYRDLEFDQARLLVAASHRAMCAQVLELSESELTEPGEFPWLGDQRMGEVIHEFLAGHYEWAVGVLTIR